MSAGGGAGFNTAQLEQFAREGYLVAHALTSLSERAAVAEIARRDLAAIKAPVEYEADTHYPGAPATADAPGGKTVRRLLRAYERDAAIARMATAAPIALRLRQLLGPRIALSQAHHNCVMTKNPRYSSVTGWHQDIRYWSYMRPELISVWIALGREFLGNGGLIVIPRSHDMEFEPRQFDSALFLRDDLEENQELIGSQQRVELEPGDVLFFHCRLLHSARANSTTETKFSLVFTYHAVDNRPLPGSRSAATPEIVLD